MLNIIWETDNLSLLPVDKVNDLLSIATKSDLEFAGAEILKKIRDTEFRLRTIQEFRKGEEEKEKLTTIFYTLRSNEQIVLDRLQEIKQKEKIRNELKQQVDNLGNKNLNKEIRLNNIFLTIYISIAIIFSILLLWKLIS